METPQIDIDALVRLKAEGAVVIDVRNPDEYEEGHVPGARSFPLPDLEQSAGDLPAGVPLYMICKSGGRSQMACDLLAPLNHDVTNVAGGTTAWIEAGHGVATGGEPG